jgi:hypothetical protein
VTTLEKIRAMVDEVRRMDPREAGGSTATLVEMTQIMAGLGYDPLAMLLPQSEAEADEMVDQLLALLLQVRGDDLAPFDLERHVRDATATDGDGA